MATGTAGLNENIKAMRACDEEWDEHTTNTIVAAKSENLTVKDMEGFRKVLPVFMRNGSFVKDARADAYAKAPSFGVDTVSSPENEDA